MEIWRDGTVRNKTVLMFSNPPTIQPSNHPTIQSSVSPSLQILGYWDAKWFIKVPKIYEHEIQNNNNLYPLLSVDRAIPASQ